ncbi:hypothetical protein PIB30_005615 [Stylosanthes scabra]|uniref:Ribonuclease H1 N-terminal domain-containing protein n=1 Tax=Stylosanthes scabra TaxID=79078 RepID=A0ABU6S3G0_9FABA|nr:hypothetical protein [Stylosanthes scabra]
MEEGKYSHYAVREGRVKGVYTSWEDCAAQVLGYKGAQFKGFKKLEEALAYMNKRSDGKGKGKSVTATSTAAEQLHPHMAKLGMGTLRTLATQGGSSSGDGSVPTGTFEDVDYVPETQGGGFLIMEDMEFYLLRACHKLECGLPKIDRKVLYDNCGEKLFAFRAGLHCEEKG